MASAKECDRCGELYKPGTFGTIYITVHKPLNDHYYDFCPKCYSSFIECLNEYKQKEDAE